MSVTRLFPGPAILVDGHFAGTTPFLVWMSVTSPPRPGGEQGLGETGRSFGDNGKRERSILFFNSFVFAGIIIPGTSVRHTESEDEDSKQGSGKAQLSPRHRKILSHVVGRRVSVYVIADRLGKL